MKKFIISFIGLLLGTVYAFGQPVLGPIEASAAQVVAGTAGPGYYISPRRLAGGGGPGVFSSVTDTGLTAGRVIFASTGGLLADDADLTFDGTSLQTKGYKGTNSTLSYAATTDIVMTNNLNTVTLAGDITFTTSGKAAGQYVTIRIICDGSNRTLAFPGTWVWVGSVAPTTLVASKVAILSLICFGTTDADVVASWVSQL